MNNTIKTITFKILLEYLVLMLLSCALPGCRSVPNNKFHPVVRNESPRNDCWTIVGFGGGGAMFHPTVSPHDPDFMFVSCDMSQSFVSYNGGSSWRMFNLRGMVDFYTFDPLDPNTVYASSIGLFRSKDKGNTWSIIYPDLNDITGIGTTGDEADQFLITKDNSERNVLALAVDPGNSKLLYAAFAVNGETALYLSEDAGSHWMKDHILEDGAGKIFVVPSSPDSDRTIYVAGHSTITSREDGRWSIATGPEGVKMVTEYAGGFDRHLNKFIIYATAGKSYFNPAGDEQGIYFTDDGGRTWQNRQEGLMAFAIKSSDPPEWRSIATSSFNPNVLYISYNGLRIHEDTLCLGIAKSEDYGRSWKLVLKDCLTRNGYRFSGNYEGGWIDERYGPTWGENPFAMGVSPTNPDICYTTDFGRAIRTIDGGKKWKQLYSVKKGGAGWISTGLDVTTGYSIVADPFDLNHMFITNTDVGLMESKDGGESWTSATRDNGIPKEWQANTYHIEFDPEVRGRAWAVMSSVHDLPRYKMWRRNGVSGFRGGILITEDGCKTFRVLSNEIGEAAMTYILIDPSGSRKSRTLYACAFGKGVYKSTDGGEHWLQKNNGISGAEPLAWSMTRRVQDGTLFLIVNRRSDNGISGTDQDGALYRSSDGAESWIRMTLPAETNGPTCLLADPHDPGHLVLSAWGRKGKKMNSEFIGGGIFVSSNDGKTWKQTLEKDQFIHDLTYDPRNKRYYACGFSGSAYRSDDNAETWERIRGFNHKFGRRVDIDPLDEESIYINTYGGGVWHGPATGDKDAVEDIITPIPPH